MKILIIFSLSFFALLGTLGFSLIPMHLWSIAMERKIKCPLNSSRYSYLVVSLVLIPICFSILLGTLTLPMVYICLLEMRCGPNRAGGLINLAIFGVSVLVVEVFWTLAKYLWSRRAMREVSLITSHCG